LKIDFFYDVAVSLLGAMSDAESKETKKMKNPLIPILAALWAAFPASALALTIHPTGSLRLEGDSTLHRFSSTVTIVTMTLDSGSKPLAEAVKAGAVKDLVVTIPVEGLKSGEKGLDKNLYKALRADKFPDILYKLDRYEGSKTEGRLTIAGQERPAAIDVEFKYGPQGVEVAGSYALKMSDFGVKPPSLMFGAIKVKDPIVIRFDLFLKEEPAEKSEK
jgi:polyisoprenoid-binding protein YceI